ncbi:MAG: HAMP domain-containing sensor histidine kinase [Filomicrobium sp.]
MDQRTDQSASPQTPPENNENRAAQNPLTKSATTARRTLARLFGSTNQAATISAWQRLRLPFKLLVLTAAFVMLAEVLIFVPSVANHRVNWLNDRLMSAHLATLAAESAPNGTIPKMLNDELLRTADVKTVAVRREGLRRIVLSPTEPFQVNAIVDLRPDADRSIFGEIGYRLNLIGEALAALVRNEKRTLRVIGPLDGQAGDFIEIVIPEAPLREALRRYGRNILVLSIIISLFTAALVYLALSRLLVLPMMRITDNMLHFAKSPDASRIIEPSLRADEVGIAERELASMQRQLSQLLLQKNRLAQLGLAVSKINHDLRNMLASAQLLSDRLASLPDPTVQRFAPKLIASLDRAINFCNGTLMYGRAQEEPPRRELIQLRPLIDEVGDGLGLPRPGEVNWVADFDDSLAVDADRDHLYRILSNLSRNALQAIEAQAGKAADNSKAPPGEIRVSAQREGRSVTIEVRDNGPGIPPRARERLFQAFQSSQRKGGSGLGLAIAQELLAAHGGTIEVLEPEVGAAFRLTIPDRSPKP